MDSFQGSSPRKFISFCLENPVEETHSTPNPTFVQGSTALDGESPRPENQLDQRASSKDDSDEDVNTYAASVVCQKEKSPSYWTDQAGNAVAQVQQTLESATTGSGIVTQVRTSTPVPGGPIEAHPSSLTSLESALRITTTAESSLPELVPVAISLIREHPGTYLSAGEDTSSSIYEVPALPGLPDQRKLPNELSDAEKTEDEISRLGYHHAQNIAFGDPESGTEGGDESGAATETTSQAEPGTSGRTADVPMQELSGRSRAILKQFFDETPPFSLPVGHPTVAFSEPQLYHLLKTLTNETLSQSFTTMEKMVLGAVRGAPATAESRTAHFRSRHRAQTPHPRMDSDTSEGGTESDSYVGPPDPGSSGTSAGEDMSVSYGESDSAAEMALIAESFQKSTADGTKQLASGVKTSAQTVDAGTSSEMSCPDETLSAIREAAIEEKTNMAPRIKKTRRKPGTVQRGVPMREEFFSKIGWTRSFISGPADPLHNPCMVWCHICKKNISIKTKGTFEIIRHHRSEKHLRRDQRWRYEHLRSVDPISGKVQHRVRGRNGKVLTKIELAKELPKFIHAELVDIGERFPFYDDFLKGSSTALVTPDSRTKTQICIISDYIQTHGDLSLLRNLWARIGSFTNYQATLCDFDWGEERLTVSIVFVDRWNRKKGGGSH